MHGDAIRTPDWLRARLRVVLGAVLWCGLATACAATATTVERSDAPTGDGEPATTETVQPDVLPDAQPEPTPDGAPGAAPEPSPDAAPAQPSGPQRFVGALQSEFVEPAGWTRPFALNRATRDIELDNGLRVIVQENAAPGGQAQLRLVVTAGSVHEGPDDLGAAHFLEHMMFNGTERWPGNELIPVLESFGAGFGPDVNAYTSFDQTVYELKVPALEEDLALAIEVLFEWASAATIEPDAVIAERGVVREEYRRSEETAGGRLNDVTRSVIFAGTERLDRYPLGTLDSINAMDAEQLRAFYETWYRPEHMTVIAVGDFFSSQWMQSQIRGRFFELESSGPVPERPVVGTVVGFAEPTYDVLTDPELTQTETTVMWRIANGPVVDRATMREEFVRRAALTLLDLRLFEATQRGGVALSAGSGARRITEDLVTVSVDARSDSADVPQALDDLLVQVEQLRQHPVMADEFGRTIDRLRALADQRESVRGSRQDFEIADALVDFAVTGDRGSVTSEEYAAVIEVLDSLTPLDIQVFFDEVLASDPYVLVTGPANESGELPEPETLAATYDAAVGWVVEPPAATDGFATSLLDRPAPVDVVEREELTELDTTVVTYANGARLAFRPTTIVENNVEFQGWSRGGFFHEDASIAPILGKAHSLVMPSGFATIDPVELDRLLSGKVVSLSGRVGRAEETLTGDANVDDLETLFQLIHLQMTEPAITDLQVRRFEEGWRPLAETPEATPEVLADMALWRLRYGDDAWFRLILTPNDLDTIDVPGVLDAWERRYADASDFVFVFVGDVDLETMVDLGARYLGTLPSGGEPEAQLDRDPGVPEANLVETVAVGVGDQGRLRINWESPYPFTVEAEVAARVLEVVVDARLRDLIREQLGASYAPSAEVTLLAEPKPWADTIIELNGDPDRLGEISTVIRDELARIRAGEIDQQYVDLAVDQLAQDWLFFSNGNWLDLMTFHLAHPERDPGEYRQRTTIAQSLTIADLASTAQVVFPETRSVEVRMVPAG